MNGANPAQLAAILDSLDATVTSIAPDGTILFVNDAAARSLSRSREEVIGTTVYDYFPDRLEAGRERIRQTLARRTTQRFESVLELPGGDVRQFDIAYYPALDATGEVVSIQIVARDVTDTRARERAPNAGESLWGTASDDLSMTYQRVKAILENVPVIISIFDPDMTIRYMNRLVPGLELRDVIGTRPTDRVGDEHKAAFQEAFQRTIEHREVTECEVEGDSGHRWLARLAPLIDEGVVKQVLGCTLDVTEQRLLQRRLASEHTLASLGTMARGIAHDFNNILAAIMNNCGLARRKHASGRDVVPQLDAIEAAAQRAADLCEQMLVYAGNDGAQPGPTDLNQVIDDYRALTKATLKPNIALSYQLASDLPPTRCNRAQLGQVVLNLINNAADAVGSDEGRIAVTTMLIEHPDGSGDFVLEPSEDGPFIALRVEDTGHGLSSEDRGRIFDPFYSTKDTGRGLGLSVVLGILRTCSAGIAVASSQGVGTTMTVLFPLFDRDHRKTEQRSASMTRDPATVLVVDDEADIRATVSELLIEVGYRVVTAASGDDALALLSSTTSAVDAVILDIVMPGRDGHVTLRELRKTHPTLPVLLSSGKPVALPCKDPHVSFLPKPYSPEALETAVSVHLTRRTDRP